jgi:hypothetical protein
MIVSPLEETVAASVHRPDGTCKEQPVGQQKVASGKRKKLVRQPPNAKPQETKLQRLEAMLRSSEGATIPQLAAALDWQPHSVRGAMSGALKRKKGLTIATTRNGGGERIYQIVE